MSGYRTYDLDIEEGGLYEIWLTPSWRAPKTCLAVRCSHPQGNFWDVLVDGTVKRIAATRVFAPGTATEPKYPTPWTISANDIVTVQPMTVPTKIFYYQGEGEEST